VVATVRNLVEVERALGIAPRASGVTA
jgi:hypothetical protein